MQRAEESAGGLVAEMVVDGQPDEQGAQAGAIARLGVGQMDLPNLPENRAASAA